MRRILLSVVFLCGLLAAAPVYAGHGHHGHFGHHHGGFGHRWGGGWGGGYWPSYGFGGGWGSYYGGSLAISVGYPYFGNGYYGFGYPNYGYGYGYGYPGYGYGYPGCGYYGYSVGYPYGYGGYSGNWVQYNPRLNSLNYLVNSSYEPAELAYGPLAVKQFLGLDRNFGLMPLRTPPVSVTPKIVAPKVVDAATVRAKVRTSNAESRRRADDYLAEGDKLFREHKFNSAVQKYKLAGQLAPDVAECYWRLGHGLIGVGQHGQAATAFRRALLLSDDVARGGFQLDDLYAGDRVLKNAHFESLAAQALESTIDADPYFLLGVMLRYNGEEARAEKFFARAAKLSPEENRPFVLAFLPPEARGADRPAVPVRAAVAAKDAEFEI